MSEDHVSHAYVAGASCRCRHCLANLGPEASPYKGMYVEYINNQQQKDKQVTTTTKKTTNRTTKAPTKPLTAAQKAAEDRAVFLKELEDYMSPEELQEFNKKLHNPLPVTVPDQVWNMYTPYIESGEETTWTNPPTTMELSWNGREVSVIDKKEVKRLEDHLSKAVNEAFKTFKPKRGTLSYKPVTLIYEDYELLT